MSTSRLAWLVLEDGAIFRGRSVGAPGRVFGELVFNTGMTGYQEVLTDPSYCGQIVVMTYPEIGIYGVNPEDVESGQLQVAGFVMHRAVRAFSNQRATQALPDYLMQAGIVGIEGVDTRALARRLRMHGAMRAAIVAAAADHITESAFRPESLLAEIGQSPLMAGRNLAQFVSPPHSNTLVAAAPGALRVVVIDAGCKHGIVRELADLGASVTTMPYDASFESVIALAPDGVLVSNGPGDPEPLEATIKLMRRLLQARVPLAGICLGHQLLGLAVGGRTYKMRFGHRGANHPVKAMGDGRIVITTQNHGFAVDPTSLGIGWAPLDSAFAASRPELCGGQASLTGVTMAECLPCIPLLGESPAGFGPVEVTHLSLNDGTVEGLRLHEYPAFSVQFHPEASPGPHDARDFFARFVALMGTAHA